MIIAFLILPAAVGFAALAVEGGLWYADHHQLRNIADAGAISAGWARKEGDDELDAALDIVVDVGYDGATDQIVLNSPPLEGVFTGDKNAIEIIARRTRPLIMTTLFMDSNEIVIASRAVVEIETKSAYCVLALDPSASGAVTVQGTADVDFDGCGVNVNSDADNALNLLGNANLDVDWVDITGDINTSGGATLTSVDTPETGAPVRADPYADLDVPRATGCDFNNTIIGAKDTSQSQVGAKDTSQSQPKRQESFKNGAAILSPGRYCNGLRLNAGADVTLNAGTYVIDAGTFRVNGSATVTGTDVTIILTGSGNNYAEIDINGGATFEITAPSFGTYAGIAVFQDRDAPSKGSNTFNGGSTMDVKGIIYIPSQDVNFSGGSKIATGCTRVVAKTITFTGNANLGNDCSDLGISEEMDDAPRLVE